MHGGWQLFSPTLLLEMEGSQLIRWVALYALASVWRRGERGKHTRVLACLASPHRDGPGWARRGVVRRWARAHDVRVNSPPKSGPKPHRPAASFCHLFCNKSVSNMVDRDRPSRLRDAVTLGRSSLYIPCGRHGNRNIPTAMKTPAHLGFAATVAVPLRLLHPVHRRASTIRRAGLWNRCPQ
jgi:hypothetical protein